MQKNNDLISMPTLEEISKFYFKALHFETKLENSKRNLNSKFLGNDEIKILNSAPSSKKYDKFISDELRFVEEIYDKYRKMFILNIYNKYDHVYFTNAEKFLLWLANLRRHMKKEEICKLGINLLFSYYLQGNLTSSKDARLEIS